MQTVTYGDDPSQFAQLHVPQGPSRGTVVVIHGGFWKDRYGIEYAEPLAVDLAARGFTAWAPEYRRVGNGGGFPETLDDIHASYAALVATGVDTSRLMVLGHSAGGHLATWSASRHHHERWSDTHPSRHGTLAAVISQAGVVDLVEAHRDDLGDRAVERFVGGPGPQLAIADPSQQPALTIPVWCVHAIDDDTVPFSQAEEYVARARALGAEAYLREVPGGHMGVVEVGSPAWGEIVEILEGLVATEGR